MLITKQKSPADQPLDAVKNSWVDGHLPPWALPYASLARLDRPIGTWLLLWPCLWGVGFAALATGEIPNWRFLILFAIGAVVMRGAGCTFNDLVDQEIDAKVDRTALRPLPSGQVSRRAAILFLGLQCLLGLAVLLQFNWFTVWLGIGSLGLVAIYPFMKRITYWPQIFLGLAFNWGALMGWSAVTGTLPTAAIVLYIAGIFWTLGYDTIYAHQDTEDDALIGVKSTAIKFGSTSKIWITGFYGAFVVLTGLSLWLAQLSWLVYLGLAAMALHLVWQLMKLNIEVPEVCLAVFRSNRDAGAFLFAGIMLVVIVQG